MTITDHGRVDYQFNELGLRDRSPSAFSQKKGTIALLGDSVAKGLYLNSTETISSKLQASLHRPVLNGAIRFSGPTTQSLHFIRDIEPHYPIREVIWLLNGSDPTDERFYRSRSAENDEFGVPRRFTSRKGDPFSESGESWLSWVQAHSKVAALIARARTFWWLRSSIQEIPASRANLCGGMERLARHLNAKKIPLTIVFTPHYHAGLVGNWMGERFNPADLSLMISCARESGAQVFDWSNESLHRDWFFEDLIHYRAAGTEWLAQRIASEIKTKDRQRNTTPDSKPKN